MLNVGKPIKTPDDVLIEIEDSAKSPDVGDISVDYEPDALDPFDQQEKMLADLGIGSHVENEDGSVTVDFSGDKPSGKPVFSGEFGANLLDSIDETACGAIALQLINDYEDDRKTRLEWEEMLAKGIQLLGLTIEQRNDPWPKSCGIYHPVLLEAVTRGWAKSIKDLAPARGPAKADLKTNKKGRSKRVIRVTTEVNSVIENDVPGYAEEQSRLSFMTHLCGSGFKKTYFDAVTKKIEDRFVSPLDLVMPYGTTDIDMCPRICHRQMLFPTEVTNQMKGGAWKTISLSSPIMETTNEASDKLDEKEGRTKPSIPNQREILEFHVDLLVEGDDFNKSGRAVPYLVVIDYSTRQVLNFRRNWKEEDTEFYKRRRYFTGYKYITGYSVYGVGMVHLIGGIAEGGTQIIRQLVDAGTLANLPAGFKARGFRVRDADKPLKPGEWRDIDFPGQRLSDAIMPLPIKEPSVVLAGLLDKLVEEARRTASSIDAAVSDIGKEAPVGSVLAILEESLVIQNSVKIGMLRSLTRELDIIVEIIKERYGEYRYIDDEDSNFEEDFAKPLRIIPSADPNAASMAQRVVAYREAINTAGAAPPNTYDTKELHRSFLEAMELPNSEKIVPLDDEIEPYDPVTENMRIIQVQPIKVFDYQNHDAHIQIHMAAMQDPLIQQQIGQSPNAAAIQAAMAAHINEHVAYKYRQSIEQFYGQALPDPEKPLPIEMERAISPQLVQAAQQVLNQSKQQAQQQAIQELAKDPVIQIKEREVANKERNTELKALEALSRAEIEKTRVALDATISLIEHNDTIKQEEKRMIMDALKHLRETKSQHILEDKRLKTQEKISSARSGQATAKKDK